MKTKFWWYLFTWTLGGLWVFITMAAGLAAMTSSKEVDLGWFALVGIILWLEGFIIEVIADSQKLNLEPKKKMKVSLLMKDFGSFLGILTTMAKLLYG